MLRLPDPTPCALGFHMPAEWEPHAATWLSWPHNPETWPGKFEPIPAYWVAMARELSVGERVEILVPDAAVERDAEQRLRDGGVGPALDGGRVRLHRVPTNDAWMRDCGPTFVVRELVGCAASESSGGEGGACAREVALCDCGYNAWGGKYPPFDADNRVPAFVESVVRAPRFETPHILEGGSIDTNGAGVLLVTESCLLNPNRNPELSRGEVETLLHAMLGVTQIVWLGDGIEGDDTDGHIDDITRFVGERTIVTAVEPDARDANHAPLAANLRLLRELRDAAGRAFEVIELPMPARHDHEDRRLPASYANFYIGNEVVLVPIFGDPQDADSLAILREHFPGRRVVGIDSLDLVWGLGAFHCVTQQQPAGAPAAR